MSERMCRFDPGSGYDKSLLIKRLVGFIIFMGSQRSAKNDNSPTVNFFQGKIAEALETLLNNSIQTIYNQTPDKHSVLLPGNCGKTLISTTRQYSIYLL